MPGKTVTIRNMQVFGSGVAQRGPFGEFTVSNEMLDRAVENFSAGVVREDGIPLKLGHTSSAFNRRVAEALGMPEELVHGDNESDKASSNGIPSPEGRPRLGTVTNLRREGGILVADFDNVAPGLATLIGENSAYQGVSAEVVYTFTHDPFDFFFGMNDSTSPDNAELSGVALLGDQQPNVGYLDQSKMRIENAEGTRSTLTVTRTWIPNATEQNTPTQDNRVVDLLTRIWQHVSNSKQTDTPAKSESEVVPDMELDTLTQLLGLENDADEAAVISAIESLQANATQDDDASEDDVTQAQDDAPVPIEIPNTAVAVDVTENNKALTDTMLTIVERLNKLESRNSELEADKTLSVYINECRSLNALPGTPEELGAKLASIHASAGEATAQEVLETYRTTNAHLNRAGAMGAIGINTASTVQSMDSHNFMVKVREFAATNSITDENVAFARYASMNPMEYNRYKNDFEAGRN